jgi:hypothetical protein
MTEHTLSRRAAGASGSGPAVAATADDTLARIADHRRLQAAIDKIIKRRSDLEEELPSDRCKSHAIFDRGTDAAKDDDPRWQAIQDEYWAAEDRIDEIAWSLIDRPPTTIVGRKALLKYAAEYQDAGYDWPDCRHHLENGVYIGHSVEDWRDGLMRVIAA